MGDYYSDTTIEWQTFKTNVKPGTNLKELLFNLDQIGWHGIASEKWQVNVSGLVIKYKHLVNYKAVRGDKIVMEKNPDYVTPPRVDASPDPGEVLFWTGVTILAIPAMIWAGICAFFGFTIPAIFQVIANKFKTSRRA